MTMNNNLSLESPLCNVRCEYLMGFFKVSCITKPHTPTSLHRRCRRRRHQHHQNHLMAFYFKSQVTDNPSNSTINNIAYIPFIVDVMRCGHYYTQFFLVPVRHFQFKRIILQKRIAPTIQQSFLSHAILSLSIVHPLRLHVSPNWFLYPSFNMIVCL